MTDYTRGHTHSRSGNPGVAAEYKQHESELQKWVKDDCVVVECIDGNIFTVKNGNTQLWNCPKCSRTSVTPGKRFYPGDLTIRTEVKMGERKMERKELVMQRDERYNRAKELVQMLGSICK